MNFLLSDMNAWTGFDRKFLGKDKKGNVVVVPLPVYDDTERLASKLDDPMNQFWLHYIHYSVLMDKVYRQPIVACLCQSQEPRRLQESRNR